MGIGFLVSIGVWVYDVRDTPGIWAVKTWQDWYHIPEQRIKIKTQLDHAEQDLMMIQAVRKDIEHKYQDPQSLIHITPNETLLAYTKKLKELELNMDELGARYNHKHPKWIALKKEYDFFCHNFQAEEDKLREEKKRLQKELEKINTDLVGLQTRLSNEAFIERAPKDIVQKERDRLSDLQSKKQKLEQNLQKLFH